MRFYIALALVAIGASITAAFSALIGLPIVLAGFAIGLENYQNER